MESYSDIFKNYSNLGGFLHYVEDNF